MPGELVGTDHRPQRSRIIMMSPCPGPMLGEEGRAVGPMSLRSLKSRFIVGVAATLLAAGAAWVASRPPDADALRGRARRANRAWAASPRPTPILQSLGPAQDPGEHLLQAQVHAALERTGPALTELAAIQDTDPLGSLARLSQGQLDGRRGAAASGLPGPISAPRSICCRAASRLIESWFTSTASSSVSTSSTHRLRLSRRSAH